MAAKKTETKAVETAARAEKRTAKKPAEPMEPTLILQFQGDDTDVNALVEAAKAAFKAEKPRTRIQSMSIYLKPEDRAAYYVINDKFDGKVDF